MTHVNYSHTEELPPYTALLVVDVKDFSGRPGRFHREITQAIPDLLRDAFDRAGLPHLWDERRFVNDLGDGHAVGFDSSALPFLLNPLLAALQRELAHRHDVGWFAEHGQPVRLRAAVNVGPMTNTGKHSLGEGSGDARVETHRLVDAKAVKDLLSRSGPPTFVAGIVSERAFIDAVASGYAGEDPSLYVPVEVEVKTYRGTAYLRVPELSGGLIRHGFTPPGRPTPPSASTPLADSGVAPTTSTVVGSAYGPINTGTGNQQNTADDPTRRRSDSSDSRWSTRRGRQ